jgi:amino acid transporter
MVATETGSGLRHNAVGLGPVIFQSLTVVAPAAGVATALPLATSYAGGATVVAIIFAIIVTGLMAITISQLARHLPSAGGMYTYVAHGLGPQAGFIVGWAVIGAYGSTGTYFWGYFGILCQDELKTVAPATPNWIWAPIAVIAGLFVWFLLERGITVSARVGFLMGMFEIVVIVGLALTLIVKAGNHNTAAVFSPNTGNPHGLSAVFTASVYTILAFIGFEAAAPLGEEARNPRRAVPIAVLTSVAVGGVVYVLAYYAATVFIGPSHMLGFVGLNGGNPWGALGTAGWGAAGILMVLVLLNSLLACANGAGNSGSRMLFSLGRVGGLPPSFAGIDRKRGTPYFAIRVISISGIIIAVGLGFLISGPLNVFAVFATAITILFVVSYMLVAVSCILFSIREPEKSGNFLVRFVVPACAFLVFIPVLLASLGIPFLGLSIAPITGVGRAGIWLAVAWIALGCIYAAWLTKAQPEAMRRMATIFEGKDQASTQRQALQEP